MKTQVIKIGNSRGVRIPQTVLAQCGISEEVDIEIENNQIIISPIKSSPRQGWEKKFQKMHEQNEDALFLPDEVQTEAFEWIW